MAHQDYKTVGLLGCETDSYDSDGARVRLAPYKHVTREIFEQSLSRFRGNIKQVPPMYVDRISFRPTWG